MAAVMDKYPRLKKNLKSEKIKMMRYQEHQLNEQTDNFLKAALFRSPKWIPAKVGILPATWFTHGEELEKIILNYSKIFPEYRKGDFKKTNPFWAYQKGRHTDIWGIVWDNIEEGFDSAPLEKEAPLRDWTVLDNYVPPNPLTVDWFWPEKEIDWGAQRKNLDEAKANGKMALCGLPHGFIYMWHYYLRGFTNFMMDVANRDPRLDRLNKTILDYNLKLVNKWLEIGAEAIFFGDDLGWQNSLPISPIDWRRYIKPSYQKILTVCREAGILSYLHSDGHILEIMDDLIECGLNVINPQFRANGLNNLTKFRGKICIHLGMDRQLFPFATTSQLKNHFQESIDALYRPEGGLMLHVEFAPDVPLSNVETICDILEKFAGPWHN